MRAAGLLLMVMLSACTGEGEAPEETTPTTPTDGLGLNVESPVAGAFNGGVWRYKVGAAWYLNAKGERLRTRFLIDNARDKLLKIKLWELAFDDPCRDAYGSLKHNRWVTFTVPATPGITRDPDQGFRYPGGLVRVAYVLDGVEETQVADSVLLDLDEVEPAARGSIAARTLQQVDALSLEGNFAVEVCIEDQFADAP